MGQIDGRIALVTGGGSGIGRNAALNRRCGIPAIAWLP